MTAPRAAVLFIHGFAQDERAFDEVQALLGASCICASYRYGAAVGHTDMDDVLTGLTEELRSLGERTVVTPTAVGYSQGGRILMEAVARGMITLADPENAPGEGVDAAERVRTTCESGDARIHGYVRNAVGALASVPVSGLVVESAAFGPLDAAQRDSFAVRNEKWAQRIRDEGVQAFMESWARLPLFDTQRSLPAERRERLACDRATMDARDLIFSLEELGQHRQSPAECTHRVMKALLDAMSPSTGTPDRPRFLYIAGAQDAKYARLGKAFVEGLDSPSASFSEVPGAGHNVHFEKPESFARILEGFLR